MADSKTIDRAIFVGPMQPWDALRASGEHDGQPLNLQTRSNGFMQVYYSMEDFAADHPGRKALGMTLRIPTDSFQGGGRTE